VGDLPLVRGKEAGETDNMTADSVVLAPVQAQAVGMAWEMTAGEISGFGHDIHSCGVVYVLADRDVPAATVAARRWHEGLLWGRAIATAAAER
jgi:hypothetical protein